MKYQLCEENIEELWKFICEKYNNKLLTIEELLYVWSGEKNFWVLQNSEIESLNEENGEINNSSNNINRDSIINFKTIIINSVYFG